MGAGGWLARRVLRSRQPAVQLAALPLASWLTRTTAM